MLSANKQEKYQGWESLRLPDQNVSGSIQMTQTNVLKIMRPVV